jgi:hypothetical protein
VGEILGKLVEIIVPTARPSEESFTPQGYWSGPHPNHLKIGFKLNNFI